MFKKAHLRLTLLYLLIIMLISLSFSVAIYLATEREIKNHADTHRLLAERLGGRFAIQEILDTADDDEVRGRVIVNLIFANLIILLLAGGTGYFLGSKTLKSIKDMVDEQNRFIADASHEFRTPLTALRTSLEVSIRDKKISLETKKLLEINLKEVITLQKLSDALLTLARMQKFSSYSGFNTIKTNEVLNDACKNIRVIAQQKRIKIIIKDNRGYKIFGDKKALTELFTIIINNAVNYSNKNTSIKIESSKSHGKVKIKVKDSGKGISDKDLPHIFKRFYRVDVARTKTKGGFGLGLSIAKRIADAHNGNIDVVSKLNQGSTFIVSFPIQEKDLR